MNDDELIATLRQQLEQKDVLLALRATEIKTLYARIATIEGQPWEVIETDAPTNAEMSAIMATGANSAPRPTWLRCTSSTCPAMAPSSHPTGAAKPVS